jgi:phage terminase large subunit-like protein
MVLGESGIVAVAALVCRSMNPQAPADLAHKSASHPHSAEGRSAARTAARSTWCDELCSWAKQQETWDMLMFG